MFYLFLRERERERENTHWRGRGRERKGDTELEAGSRFWAVSTEPNAGLKPMNWEIMTWAEVRYFAYWATQRPYINNILYLGYWFLWCPRQAGEHYSSPKGRPPGLWLLPTLWQDRSSLAFGLLGHVEMPVHWSLVTCHQAKGRFGASSQESRPLFFFFFICLSAFLTFLIAP